MNTSGINRRKALERIVKTFSGAFLLSAIQPAKTFAEKAVGSPVGTSIKNALKKRSLAKMTPKGYDPLKHQWRIYFDVDRCIGCGLCVEACKKENKVPDEPFYFRTWVERYIIKKPEPGSGQIRGETFVDSPNGGRDGFPPSPIPDDEIQRSFFVPKLCNHCTHSPCTQSCPVGATFDSPDGVVLIDPSYCIGCGFCIQACPYGCRFMNPETHTAEKCTMCYHRITRGLKPACIEVCPTGARIFGDLLNPVENDPLQKFIQENKVDVLKPHLRTSPNVLYAGLDGEVR